MSFLSALFTQGLRGLAARCGFLFPQLRADRPVDESVVLLVAGEFVDRRVDFRQDTVDRPRPGPRSGIGHGELIAERLRADEREALDQVHRTSGPSPVPLAVEIGGLDDKRRAVPAA